MIQLAWKNPDARGRVTYGDVEFYATHSNMTFLLYKANEQGICRLVGYEWIRHEMHEAYRDIDPHFITLSTLDKLAQEILRDFISGKSQVSQQPQIIWTIAMSRHEELLYPGYLWIAHVRTVTLVVYPSEIGPNTWRIRGFIRHNGAKYVCEYHVSSQSPDVPFDAFTERARIMIHTLEEHANG